MGIRILKKSKDFAFVIVHIRLVSRYKHMGYVMAKQSDFEPSQLVDADWDEGKSAWVNYVGNNVIMKIPVSERKKIIEQNDREAIANFVGTLSIEKQKEMLDKGKAVQRETEAISVDSSQIPVKPVAKANAAQVSRATSPMKGTGKGKGKGKGKGSAKKTEKTEPILSGKIPGEVEVTVHRE